MSYDIHIEGLPEAEVKGPRFMAFGNYPRVQGVQGIQKLVDHFLKCLCTPKGSSLSNKNYGTPLLSMFLNNVDPRTLRQAAVMAVQDAESQIRQFNMDNASPDSERLAGITIESVNVDTTNVGLELSLLLKNVAGTVVRVLLPLTA